MLSDINYFNGTENYYKHWLGIHYTDGVKYVAEEASAYWLIDAIGSYQPKLRNEEFQSWTLKQNPNQTWTLRATDGNDKILAEQKIEFSDFPLNKIAFYLVDKILMLTSEY